MSNFKEKYSNGLYYRIYGSGEPLVLLHGFLGSGRDFNEIIEGLSSRFKILVPDLPGFGNSREYEVQEDYGMQAMIDAVCFMLGSEGIFEINVLGYSMGGRIGLALAAEERSPVQKLMLLSSNPGEDDEKARTARAKLDTERAEQIRTDVNFKVAKEFCSKVAEEARGEEILKSLSPGEQVVKVVHEKLIELLGSSAAELNLGEAPPIIIMLVGLQGSGKTTSCAKLARYLRDDLKRTPMLVPADVYRPAAIDQLKTLAGQISIPVYDSTTDMEPLAIAKDAIAKAQADGCDTLILDTAGRLQIDDEMMTELQEISEVIQPHEILLVADAMTGQEAVNVARGFDEALEIDGLILTKLDGDARGGAALSMKSVTGRPVKFIGLGEKLDALEVFHPDRMASRILGMGDVLSLIEKASKEMDMEESLELQKKMRKNEFTLDDFLGQLRMMKKMGNMGSLMGMIPGMGKLAKQIDPEAADKELKKIEAIILSMTKQERRKHTIINGSRRKRIAKGSGTRVQDVNNLLKQFTQMRTMMKKMSKGGLGNLMNMFGGGGGMPDISKLMGKM